MPKKTPQKRDGVYQSKDRPGWWISWTDAQGRRRYRKTDAQNILSPAFLSDAVGKLDAVIGDALGLKRGEYGKERYQDVNGVFALTDGTNTSG
jgi:hypothetical protein